MIREADIEAYFVKQVANAGCVAYKFVSPGRSNVPDRMVLMPGRRVYFVELKAPGNNPTAAQIREHARFARTGHQVQVIDTKAGVDAWIAGVKNWWTLSPAHTKG
jgi:hypothetical protein